MYSPIIKIPIALKYIVYLLFGIIMQEKCHLPIKDSYYTMISFLYNCDSLLEQFEEMKNFSPVKEHKNYLGWENKGNREISNIMKELVMKGKDWPVELKRKMFTKRQAKLDWNDEEFVLVQSSATRAKIN